MPVWLMIPPVVASPNACVALSMSDQSSPPAPLAVRAPGSTLTAFIIERSIIRLSSDTACPATA